MDGQLHRRRTSFCLVQLDPSLEHRALGRTWCVVHFLCSSRDPLDRLVRLACTVNAWPDRPANTSEGLVWFVLHVPRLPPQNTVDSNDSTSQGRTVCLPLRPLDRHINGRLHLTQPPDVAFLARPVSNASDLSSLQLRQNRLLLYSLDTLHFPLLPTHLRVNGLFVASRPKAIPLILPPSTLHDVAGRRPLRAYDVTDPES